MRGLVRCRLRKPPHFQSLTLAGLLPNFHLVVFSTDWALLVRTFRLFATPPLCFKGVTPPHITLPNVYKTRLLDTDGPSGTPVLVHGRGNSHEIWDRVLPQLAHSFRVIAFDLPGFGEASRPDAVYNGPFFAAQIVALLDALGIERATLIGNSLSASAALDMSTIAPHRIQRAVYEATT